MWARYAWCDSSEDERPYVGVVAGWRLWSLGRAWSNPHFDQRKVQKRCVAIAGWQNTLFHAPMGSVRSFGTPFVS